MAAKSTITVSGMHCSSCGMLIDETLEELPGVTSALTDLRRETTTVEYDPAQTGLAAIRREPSSATPPGRPEQPRRPAAGTTSGGTFPANQPQPARPRQDRHRSAAKQTAHLSYNL
jgi:Cu+-exporting ATPase